MSRSDPSPPRVQFVSKPMTPPFRDGSKCLVRDICLHLEGFEPHVMGTGVPAPELGQHTVSHSVYGEGGKFSPALRQNIQAALFMLAKSRANLWHFVFAPNPKSSKVGHFLRKLRRVPTVQTIASPPRTFERPGALLFGDISVAQSEWTRTQFAAALDAEKSERRIEMIPPPAPQLGPVGPERSARERARLGVRPEQPLFLYPGDLEVSQGAAHVVDWAPEIARRLPGARVHVAYRDKTSSAEERATALREQADPNAVSFECNAPDIHALVATATALLFPVDDLYGKVDLPIVLLEAMRLGTPVICLNVGPLASLQGALLVPDEPSDWLDAVVRLTTDDAARAERIAEQRQAIEREYAPELVARRYEALYRELLNGN